MLEFQESLSSKPKDGMGTERFLLWENAQIKGLKKSDTLKPIVASWEAANGICVTRKETRLPNYSSCKKMFEERGLQVSIRQSGGTAVPHGKGIINVTALTAHNGPRSIKHSYSVFCGSLQRSLSQFGLSSTIGAAFGSFCDGDYNVLIENKKVIGTSQRWVKHENMSKWIVVNHAVIMASACPVTMTRRVNEFYRQAGSGQTFYPQNVASLSDYLSKYDEELEAEIRLRLETNLVSDYSQN